MQLSLGIKSWWERDALATNIGDTFFYEKGKESQGGGQSQGCAGSMSRSLLLAHGKFYLSRCIGSGGWIFGGPSPTCSLAERSFGILFPSDPGDAAARPLASPAPPSKIFSPGASIFLSHPCLLIGNGGKGIIQMGEISKTGSV
jgi:hypothetical protein